MAKELGTGGIAVNTVAPEPSRPIFLAARPAPSPEYKDIFAGTTALTHGSQRDNIGPIVANLFPESNRWISAQRIEMSAAGVSDPSGVGASPTTRRPRVCLNRRRR